MNACSLLPLPHLTYHIPPHPPCTTWWHTLNENQHAAYIYCHVFSQALWVTEKCLITVHMLHKIVNLCLSKSISDNSLWPPLVTVTRITDQISEHWLKMKDFVIIKMFTFVVHSPPIIKRRRLIDFFLILLNFMFR